MNENTTAQVIEATEGVAAVAESVNWRKAGKIAGGIGVGIGALLLIGKGIEWALNKKKQDVNTSEDNQAEEVDSVESDEE